MIHGYSAKTIQAVEKPYITAPDYNGWLMAKASDSLAKYCSERLQEQSITRAKIMVLAGKGNNGADALFSGMHLLRQGHAVVAYLSTGVAHAGALYEFQRAGGQILDFEGFVSLLPVTDLVIDGLLGIGAVGEPNPEINAVIQALNTAHREHKVFVVACDVPSGITAGKDYTKAVHADATVTFIAAKDSLLLAPEHVVGALHPIPLGIEEDLADYQPTLSRWDAAELAEFFPHPEPTDHKYSRGVCGIVAGSPEYPGAALLATSAAVRAGCGMAKFFGPDSLRFHITGQIPEAVTSAGPLDGEAPTAWLLGPGAVGDDRRTDIITALASGRPAVIDAAALEPAAQWIADQGKLSPAHILTPHAGELLRLLTWLYALAPEAWTEKVQLGEPTKEAIAENPLEWTKLAAQLTGATVLLKGNLAYIATPNGQAYCYRAQTAGLATAGSGDTLSGILASLLSQHTARWETHNYPVPESNYAKLVALALHLHNQAALEANGGLPGPVPPSHLNQHLPQTIAKLLS